jgi:hypothetical protein
MHASTDSAFSFSSLCAPCAPQYPQWSKLLHLPLALKFWGLKVLAQYGWERYVQWERDCVTARLADLETRLIEERLPVPENDPPSTQRVSAGWESDPDVDGSESA